MFKQTLLVLALLAVAIGCGGGRQGLARPVVLSPDQQVLADREAVISTATDPQTEQSAQEWARIAADRERQQMEYNLRLREQRSREAQERAFRAEQAKRDKAYQEQAERQQKLDALNRVGYQLQDLGRQIQYYRNQRHH